MRMRRTISVFVALLALSSFTMNSGVEWLTDFEKAKSTADDSGKMILLSFSGSDWCANCIRLEKTLFSSEEFTAFATENLVLLNADFPARSKNKLSKEQTAHNEALAEKYNKAGKFPTVLLLDATGKVLGKLDHPKETVEAYMAQLKSLVNE